MKEAKKIIFKLDGCDISFVAIAPEDITLKQLLAQCDKIKPDWCACGIRSIRDDDIYNQRNIEDYCDELKVEIEIEYDSIKKANDAVPCTIVDYLKKVSE